MRGEGVLFLYYADQAFNARDDGAVSGKSSHARDVDASELSLCGEGSLGRLLGGPPPWESSKTSKWTRETARPSGRCMHDRHACMLAPCALSL